MIDDLQRTFRKEHPGASAEAEACFLESWDVLRHVVIVCGRLAVSAEADQLIRCAGMDRQLKQYYIEIAREVIHLQLAAYLAQMHTLMTVPRPSELNSPVQTGLQGPSKPVAPIVDRNVRAPGPSPHALRSDPFSTKAARNKAIQDFVDAWELPSRIAAAQKFNVHYQDLNRWKLHRELAKHRSVKQDRIEERILTRPSKTSG
jgi:hypothetical protein